MKVLQIVQRHYVALGISSSSNQSTQKYPFNERILFGFLLNGFSVVSEIVHTIYVANTFMDYVVCISEISAGCTMFVIIVAIIFRKNTLFECIDGIESIIDIMSKYPQSEASFRETNRLVERLSEIIFMVLLKIVIPLATFPKFIASFGLYALTDLGSDSFELPFPLWFPFDTNNPIGFFIAFILEYIILGYQYFLIACTLSLAMGGYLFAFAGTKEFQRLAPIYNEKAQTNQSNEFKILLKDFTDAHGIAKQIIHDSSDIFQPIIMYVFTWSLLVISGIMLVIQMEILHHDNIMFLSIMILDGIVALAIVYIACELGQRLTDAFDGIGSTVDQLDWYLFPIEIKRMLPMIIANAQQPVEMECFGSITCSREVFKKIINRAYSYFTVLRHINN